MATPTFTDAQRAQLLGIAGVLDEIESATETDTTPEVIDTPTDDNAEALAAILAKSKGVRSTGETLVGQHIDKLWSQRKLSKVQAASQGLVASEHNKAAWAELQTLRASMLTAVRKASREASHVAPKIAAKTAAKRTPEVDALLLQHAGNPAIEQLAALLGL